MIYLDHAATTPMDPRVLDAMMPYLTYEFGNPGSLHSYGKTAKEAVDNARRQVARFFNCEPEQVIFTSGGSEGNNMVISGLENELLTRGKTGVIVSAIEHDSVLKAARKLCMKPEFHLQICPPNTDGQVSLSSVQGLIKEDTGLVSVMVANNETGVVNDTAAIGKFCHDNGILFHADAVQAAGVIPLDTSDYLRSVDYMTISGHKINGPKGIGAVFVRNPSTLVPLVCGGAEQEYGLRGGTENVACIVGLGKACELSMSEYAKHLAYLSQQHSQLISILKLNAQERGIEMIVNGDPANAVPKTVNVCFPGVDAQTLLLLLDMEGVFVSAGSACTSHENMASHVLTAMGITEDNARSSIRISISHINTSEEIDSAARTIIECVSILKERDDN